MNFHQLRYKNFDLYAHKSPPRCIQFMAIFCHFVIKVQKNQ